MVVSKAFLDKALDDQQVYQTLKAGLEQVSLASKRVLVLIPDNTRSCPLPMMFRYLCDLVGSKAAKLDFLIALGTHQPMPQQKINQLVGITAQQRAGEFSKFNIYNHRWDLPDTFTTLGVISKEQIHKISAGLMHQEVPVTLNKMIMDYDQLMICGPTFPHEVVGFSGGLKYFFPGIAGWELINFFHWLGAVITCINIIGTSDTPVRQVINHAAKLIDRPILNIDMVVKDAQLRGLFVGQAQETYQEAAQLSDKLHIVYKDRPYKLVLGIAPEMYDDIWTAGKVMYKLEPIVADAGELIIYAPHVSEISYTHGKVIDQIGYHVRDYFLKQMDKFPDVPRGVMAHSTHVRGLGSFENGVEKPRITVTLATAIPPQRCRKVKLSYRDPQKLDPDQFRSREDEGILVVDHAGEVLHRLKEPDKYITVNV